SGDPRVWFSRLGGYALPGDLLLVLADRNTLYVVNASKPSVWRTRSVTGSPLHEQLQRLSARTSSTASELLKKLRAICARGFILSARRGDTGVGATLERELGIRTNSSKAPDYKGIEIKASRRT